MRKFSTILLILLFSSSCLFAQFEKGKYFIAGYSNLGIDIGKNKQKFDGTTTENYKYSEFFLTPEAGYFVADNLMVGLFMDFDFEHYSYDDGDSKENYTTFIIGPDVRYYFLKLDKFNPYAAVRFGVGVNKYKAKYSSGSDDESKRNFFTTRIGAGGTYFINDQLGLDLFAGYDYDKWTTKVDEEDYKKSTLSEKASDIFSSVEVNLGLVFVF